MRRSQLTSHDLIAPVSITKLHVVIQREVCMKLVQARLVPVQTQHRSGTDQVQHKPPRPVNNTERQTAYLRWTPYAYPPLDLAFPGRRTLRLLIALPALLFSEFCPIGIMTVNSLSIWQRVLCKSSLQEFSGRVPCRLRFNARGVSVWRRVHFLLALSVSVFCQILLPLKRLSPVAFMCNSPKLSETLSRSHLTGKVFQAQDNELHFYD